MGFAPGIDIVFMTISADIGALYMSRIQTIVIGCLHQRFDANEEVRGFEVDDVSRAVIAERGYGEYFVHRTGHSIDTDLHGSGPNLDNLETRDDRRLLPGVAFSVEPGIYLEDFGVRSEIDMYVDPEEGPVITSSMQQDVLRLMQ